MSNRPMDELDRWLAAEQAGGLEEADALFAAVVQRHLPLLEEPAGLSAAVRASLPRAKRFAWFVTILNGGFPRWAQAIVAASVAVLGAAPALLSLGRLIEFWSWSVEALAHAATGTVAALAVVARVCGAVIALLGDLGRAALLVAGSGVAPALILASAVVASLAFLGLSRLLSPREEFS